MRLYTRGQLVCAVVFSIIVTSVGVSAISLKISKNNEAKKTDQENQIQIEEIATSESEEKNTLLPVSNSYFTTFLSFNRQQRYKKKAIVCLLSL